MSLQAHVVVLWLAAQAQAERVLPQCRPNTQHSCQWLRTDANRDYFQVNGREIEIAYEAGVSYHAPCSAAALDDPAFPRFPHPIHFKRVDLTRCTPPAAGYVAALQALNVIVTDELYLWVIPEQSKISAASFEGLPKYFQVLSLRAHSGVLNLEPGALDQLDELRELILWGVTSDRLPTYLEALELHNTEIKTLSVKSLYLSSLVIHENHLESTNISAPSLSSVQLLAPELVSLVVLDAAPKLLKDGLLEHCPALEVLELRRARAQALPAQLLRSAICLTRFTYTFGDLTTLPENFFTDNKHLRYIDLRDNSLMFLPSSLFSGLAELLVLRLDNNLLDVRHLTALFALTVKTSVQLCGNVRIDTCPEGLTKVQIL